MRKHDFKFPFHLQTISFYDCWSEIIMQVKTWTAKKKKLLLPAEAFILDV